MKKITYSFSNKTDLSKFESIFFAENKDYKITQTNYSMIYENSTSKYLFNKEYFGKGALNLIVQNKIHILKNIKDKKLVIEDIKPRYFTFNAANFKNEYGEINDFAELDINSAYIYSAYILGFIDKQWFERLNSISKPMRLKVLGSIATRKNITECIDGEKFSYVKEDLVLCNVWKMICRGCDSLIFDAIIYNSSEMFLFYWFDNLFLKAPTGEIIFVDQSLYKVRYGLDLRYEYLNRCLKIDILQTGKRFTIPNYKKR